MTEGTKRMSTSKSGFAGAATVDISPPRSYPGYFGNVFRKSRLDCSILAHAVVVDDGSNRAAVVAADLATLGRPEVLAIRELAELRTGIPKKNIFIAANHAHSAPTVGPVWISGNQPDPFYADLVTCRILDVITRAASTLRPAVIKAGSAAAPGITFNRRLLRPDGSVVHTVVLQQSPHANDLDPDYPPAGPVDEDVTYIHFQEPSGAPIACLMSFSCHNHSSGAQFFHRDLFGRAGDVLRKRLRVNVPTPFVAGACGDTMWVDVKAGLPADLEEFTWVAGARLADAVFADLKSSPEQRISNVAVRTLVQEIEDRPLEESEFCEDNCRGTDERARRFAEGRYGPEKAALELRGRTKCLVEVGAMALSEQVAISANTAELFVAFGLEVKRRSPFPITMISELTNGYCGYVPTEEGFRQGGYEAHRGVFTSRLAKNGGRVITDTSVRLLQQCVSE